MLWTLAENPRLPSLSLQQRLCNQSLPTINCGTVFRFRFRGRKPSGGLDCSLLLGRVHNNLYSSFAPTPSLVWLPEVLALWQLVKRDVFESRALRVNYNSTYLIK